MKKTITIIILSLIFVCPILIAGLSDSPPVSLPIDEQLSPNDRVVVYITTSNLVLGRYYMITCDIYNPNYSKTYPAILSMSAATALGQYSYVGTITLNGKELNHSQGVLNQNINKYVLSGAEINTSSDKIVLSFINFDSADAVMLQNCWATYLSKKI